MPDLNTLDLADAANTPTVLKALTHAAYERLNVAFTGEVPTYPQDGATDFPGPPAQIKYTGATTTNGLAIGELQALVELLDNPFDGPELFIDEDPDAPGWPTGAGMRISETLDSGVGPSGWWRRCPRTITSTSSTVDTEGNAAANGQRARLRPTLTAFAGVYERVGGAWVFNGTTGWDVLEMGAATGSVAQPGRRKRGDYFTTKLFEEIIAVLKAASAVGRYASWYDYTLSAGSGLVPTDLFDPGPKSIATAKARALAAYAPDAGGGGPRMESRIVASYDEFSPPSEYEAYQASLVHISAKPQINFAEQWFGSGLVYRGVPCSVEWWAYARAPQPSGLNPVVEFDADGTGLAQDAYGLIHMEALAAGAHAGEVYQSDHLIDPTDPPPWPTVDPAEPPLADTDTMGSSRGYVTNGNSEEDLPTFVAVLRPTFHWT